MQGKDVSTATSGYDLQNGRAGTSQLNFKGSGQAAWTQLTQDAIDAQNKDGQPHQVAIVLDNEVVSAPSINEVIPGSAIINGGGINEDELQDAGHAAEVRLAAAVVPDPDHRQRLGDAGPGPDEGRPARRCASAWRWSSSTA